jgi:hypothetical protein
MLSTTGSDLIDKIVPPSALLTPPRGAKVFVCYARKNGKFIQDWFVPLLRSAGVDVFLDTDIEPGDEWEGRILTEIRLADRFLLFWTRAAARSKWVRREYETGPHCAHLADRSHTGEKFTAAWASSGKPR